MGWDGAITAWSDFETYLYLLLLQRGYQPVTYFARAFGWKEFCRNEWFKAPGQDLLSAKAFKQTLETGGKKKKNFFFSISKQNAFPRGKKVIWGCGSNLSHWGEPSEEPGSAGRDNILQWLGRLRAAHEVKLPRSTAQPLTLHCKALSSLHRLLEPKIAAAQRKQFLSTLCPAGTAAPRPAMLPSTGLSSRSWGSCANELGLVKAFLSPTS